MLAARSRESAARPRWRGGIAEAGLRDLGELGGHRNDRLLRGRGEETSPERAREVLPRASLRLELREPRGDEHRVGVGLERPLEQLRGRAHVTFGSREIRGVAEERGTCSLRPDDVGQRTRGEHGRAAVAELLGCAREQDRRARARGIDRERLVSGLRGLASSRRPGAGAVRAPPSGRRARCRPRLLRAADASPRMRGRPHAGRCRSTPAHALGARGRRGRPHRALRGRSGGPTATSSVPSGRVHATSEASAMSARAARVVCVTSAERASALASCGAERDERASRSATRRVTKSRAPEARSVSAFAPSAARPPSSERTAARSGGTSFDSSAGSAARAPRRSRRSSTRRCPSSAAPMAICPVSSAVRAST